MSDQNYTTAFTVGQTPDEVFKAVTHVRGWWSEEIEGDTDKLGAVFYYHYQDVHRCSFKITEFVPGKKVVWHVLANYFNFVKDKTEWTGTDVVFEITRQGDKTAIYFTHVGLVPAYECYDVCSNAWGSYITRSLRDLITIGKGQPNPIEEVVSKARLMSDQNYTTAFTVDQSSEQVFDAVNNVRGWWSGEIKGDTDQLGAEFTYRYEDVHRSTHKITEFVPGEKVVWHTMDSHLDSFKDKSEWNGTDVIFEIAKKGDRTELRFTHAGLIPAFECYSDCSGAWGYYINDKLFNLITTGKGQPEQKENGNGEKASR
jgi:hypothetical protein